MGRVMDSLDCTSCQYSIDKFEPTKNVSKMDVVGAIGMAVAGCNNVINPFGPEPDDKYV